MSSIHALNIPFFSFVHCSTAGNASLTTRLQDASAAAPSAFSLHAPVSWNQLDAAAVIAAPLPSFATPALRLFRAEPAVLEPRVQPLATALLEAVFTKPPLVASPVLLYADPLAGRVQDKPFPGSRRVLVQLWEGRLSFRIYGEPLDLTASNIWKETVSRVQDGWDWIHNELQSEHLDLQEALGRVPGPWKDLFILSTLRRLASGRLRSEGGIDELLAVTRPLLQSCHARETMELLLRLRRRLEQGKIPVVAETKILDDLLKPYDERLKPLLAELRGNLKSTDDERGALRAAVTLILLGETNDAEEVFWTRSDRWFGNYDHERLLQTILALDPHDALARLIPLLESACRQDDNSALAGLCFETIGLLGIPEALPALNGLFELTGRTYFKGDIGLDAAVAYARLGDWDNAKAQAIISGLPESAHLLIHLVEEKTALLKASDVLKRHRNEDTSELLTPIRMMALYHSGWASTLLADALENDSFEIHIAAAEALGDRQTLLNFLKNPQAWIAIEAAGALMRLGDFDEARERLMDILKDDPNALPVMALGTMGRHFPPEFAAELNPFLDKSYWAERQSVDSPLHFVSTVVWALGKIGNPDSLPLLLPFLLDSENPTLVESAAKAVAALGRPEEARRALMGLFTTDRNPYALSLLLDMVSMG